MVYFCLLGLSLDGIFMRHNACMDGRFCICKCSKRDSCVAFECDARVWLGNTAEKQRSRLFVSYRDIFA